MAAGWAATSGPAIAIVLARWFDRKRGFAISLALNGASASGFTVAPLLVRLSHTAGLHQAVLGLRIRRLGYPDPGRPLGHAFARSHGCSAVSVQMESRRDATRRMLSTCQFWSVALPFALAISAQVGFIVHMVAFLLPCWAPAAPVSRSPVPAWRRCSAGSLWGP